MPQSRLRQISWRDILWCLSAGFALHLVQPVFAALRLACPTCSARKVFSAQCFSIQRSARETPAKNSNLISNSDRARSLGRIPFPRLSGEELCFFATEDDVLINMNTRWFIRLIYKITNRNPRALLLLARGFEKVLTELTELTELTARGTRNPAEAFSAFLF